MKRKIETKSEVAITRLERGLAVTTHLISEDHTID